MNQDNKIELIFSLGHSRWIQNPQQVCHNGRKKRSATGYHDYRMKRSPTTFNTPDLTSDGFSQPTLSNITDEEATELCRNAIRTSPAFNKCYQMFGDFIFNSTLSCIDDIKVSLVTKHPLNKNIARQTLYRKPV